MKALSTLFLASVLLFTEQLAPQNQPVDIAKAEAATTSAPTSALAWEQLGLAYLAAGRPQDAIVPLQKALDLGFAPIGGKYNLACAYARSGDKKRSLDLLQQIVDAGGGMAFPFDQDEDLASLKQEPQFTAMVASLEVRRQPCRNGKAHPEYRQFDFWVGDWNVYSVAGQFANQKVGESSVQLILKDCVVFENWTALGRGGEGKSFNKYNPQLQKWEQFWVADSGGTTHYVGDAAPGQMIYLAEPAGPRGAPLIRLSFTRLSPDKVRQFSELSFDQGKSWQVGYDFIYLRKGSAATISKTGE